MTVVIESKKYLELFEKYDGIFICDIYMYINEKYFLKREKNLISCK